LLKPSNINKVSFQWQEKSILNVPKNYEKSKIIYIVVVFPTIKMSYNKTVALQNIFKIKTNSNTSYRIIFFFFNAYYLVASVLIKKPFISILSNSCWSTCIVNSWNQLFHSSQQNVEQFTLQKISTKIYSVRQHTRVKNNLLFSLSILLISTSSWEDYDFIYNGILVFSKRVLQETVLINNLTQGNFNLKQN
jgi:hypothetical protein